MRTMTAADPTTTDLFLWARAVDQAPPTNWKSVLDRLQKEFDDYSIKRLPSFWMASDLDPDTDTEPTIIETTTERFVQSLISPGPRYGTY